MQFLASGGISNTGLKLYYIEQDGQYYIFDCGSKTPDEEDYGIEKVIPDTKFIKKNKNKIKKIFISNISDDSIGSLSTMITILDEVEVYGSEFTVNYLKRYFSKDKCIFKVLYNKRKYIFGNLQITAFFITYELPGNYGFLVKSGTSTLLLISNFTFYDDVPTIFNTDLDFLANLKHNNKIDYLFVGCKGIEQSSKYKKNDFLQKTLPLLNKTKGNIFLNCHTENILLIYKIIKLAEENNYKVKILGEKATKLIRILVDSNKLKLNNRNVLLNNNNFKTKNKIMYLVLSDSGFPYDLMESILDNLHKTVSINKSDLVMFSTPRIPGKEHRTSELINKAFSRQIKAIELDIPEVNRIDADIQDLSFLNSMVKPRNIIPINAEYRLLVKYKNLFLNNSSRIQIIVEGDLLNINRREINRNKFRFENNYIYGENIEYKDNKYLKERERLAHNGIIGIQVQISISNHKIVLKKINHKSLGFIEKNMQPIFFSKLDDIIIKEIKLSNSNNDVRLIKLKQTIEDSIEDFLLKEERNPIIELQFTT